METDLISVADAIAILDAAEVQPRIVELDLAQAAGLRLAQDIAADRDYPPFDKALMDGFALRAAEAPGPLKIVGEIAAGNRADRAVGPGEAMAIMTGAPMPAGADTVVPIEDSSAADGLERVMIKIASRPGMNIARRGSDCAAGSVVLQRGTKLSAAQLAVAASVGAARAAVFARPRVAVLSTGDELVEIAATPGPAQIRNSNNIMLVSLLERLGCDVTDMGTARDDPAIIRSTIEEGMQSDLLLISGGMSMGRYDYVPKILLELGLELKITKLRIKPGKPFIFGKRRGTGALPGPLVFGLPGNPVSGFVCTLRLCSRLIARMLGADSIERWADARLEAPVDSNGVREFYQPAILAGPSVLPLKWKGSADIYTLARANALIVRPENSPPLPAGAGVRVLEIPT